MLYCFEKIQFDTDTREIRHESKDRKSAEITILRDLVFRTLEYLITHRNRVVTKDELAEEVWESQDVSDGSISQCIKDVRRAIQDDRKGRVIKTVSKVGYKFVADLVTMEMQGRIHNLNKYPRLAKFVGRQSIFDTLQAYYAQGGHDHRLQVLCGLGGSGKTTIAIEYAYRQFDHMSVVWVVRATTLGLLSRELATFAQALGLPVTGSATIDEICQQVRRYLNIHAGWLIVLDDIPSYEFLARVCPEQSTGGQLLATSRNLLLGKYIAHPLHIDRFERSESLQLLEADEANSEAQALAKRLGDLPLALRQAADYVTESGINFSQYLERFAKQRQRCLALRSLHNEDQSDANKDQSDETMTVMTTWKVAFDEISQNQQAGALLHLVAFLLSPCPRSFLTAAFREYVPKELQEAVEDDILMDSTVALLRRFGLIDSSEGILIMHPLVQEVTRLCIPSEALSPWCQAALDYVIGVFQKLFTRDWTDPQVAAFAPQVTAALAAVIQEALRQSSPDPALAQACSRAASLLGIYYDNEYRADAENAKIAWGYHIRALEALPKAFQASQKEELRSLRFYSTAMSRLGQSEALTFMEKAIALARSMAPEEQATTLDFASLVYKNLDMLPEALQMINEALQLTPLTAQASSSETFNYARSLDNRGKIHAALWKRSKRREDARAAERDLEEALRLRETLVSLSPDMAYELALGQFNLGEILVSLSDNTQPDPAKLQKGVRLLRLSVSGITRKFPLPHHPLVEHAYATLCWAEAKQGRDITNDHLLPLINLRRARGTYNTIETVRLWHKVAEIKLMLGDETMSARILLDKEWSLLGVLEGDCRGDCRGIYESLMRFPKQVVPEATRYQLQEEAKRYVERLGGIWEHFARELDTELSQLPFQ